ncbi:tryptophan-rich sensory protein [Roseomonas sp. CCTCC AB2023176]|uniref:tryptophan-rich sensory protein n=1 Tax=Roseomonas sp. CCTCC AB2023176 TaxID=3342640 RepID=UPI0035E13953
MWRHVQPDPLRHRLCRGRRRPLRRRSPPRTAPGTGLPLAPPRVGFGIAWSILFAMMGVARGRLDKPRQHRVDRLWLLCATYPLYTLGMRSRTLSYIGNAVVGFEAARTAAEAHKRDATAGLLIGAVVPWVAYATLILLTDRDD